MKQSTFSAFVANSIKNLLQGYTKGIRITAILILLLMGVSNAWAVDASNAIVYYDNTASNWSDVQILIGKSDWSFVYTLSKISGTNNLYCKTSLSWGGYSEFYFVTGASSWGDEGNSPTHRKDYVTNYSAKKTTGLGSNKYLYVSSGTSKGASLTETKLNNGYSDLNYTQTVQQHLSTDGGTNYSASTTALATVKVSSNKLNGNSSTTSNSGTITSGTSSATCSAARTATVTYTVTDVKSGYTFVGWYDGTTQKSTETTYNALKATGAKTITARFKANQYTITYKDQGGSNFSGVHASGYPTTHTYGTATTLKDPTKDGYTFDGWFTNSGCTGSAVNSLGATAYTANITLYAKWTATETLYDVDIKAEEGGSVSKTEVSVNESITEEIIATPNEGYKFVGWETEGGAQVADKDRFSTINATSTIVTATAAGSVTALFEALLPNMLTLTHQPMYKDQENPLDGAGGNGSEATPYKIYSEEVVRITATELPAVDGLTAHYKFGELEQESNVFDFNNISSSTATKINVKAYYKKDGTRYGDEVSADSYYFLILSLPYYVSTVPSNEMSLERIAAGEDIKVQFRSDDKTTVNLYVQIGDDESTKMWLKRISSTASYDYDYVVPDNIEPCVLRFIAESEGLHNGRSFSKYAEVALYKNVTIKVNDPNGIMSKVYMWRGDDIKSEWPGESFAQNFDTWRVFVVKYPYYDHFVLNDGTNENQTFDYIIPAEDKCYQLSENKVEVGGYTNYQITETTCPSDLLVGDIDAVTVGVGEQKVVIPSVEVGLGYQISDLVTTVSSSNTSKATAVVSGKNIIVTGVATGDATITVKYTLDGTTVTKQFTVTITAATSVTIQVKVPIASEGTYVNIGWADNSKLYLHYWETGKAGNSVQLSFLGEETGKYKHLQAEIPLYNGTTNFLVYYEDMSANWKKSPDVTNVTTDGCYAMKNEGYEKQPSISRAADYCWVEYQVKTLMQSGKEFTSNIVADANGIMSFFAPGKDETGRKAGAVMLYCNGSVVAAIDPATFETSTVYTATINDEGNGLENVAPYTGNYYIRTWGKSNDIENKGWHSIHDWNDSQKNSRKMTFFISREGEFYNHYWVQAVDPYNGGKDVSACVANDYNDDLAGKLTGDKNTDEYGNIKFDNTMNVRFGYDPRTNYFGRAILRGSGQNQDYLNLHCNNAYSDAACTKQLPYGTSNLSNKFRDISNWVYEREVYVKIDNNNPSASMYIEARSPRNDKTVKNHLLGYIINEGTGEETSNPIQKTVIGSGTDNGVYKVRVVYDFKTNRMISVWQPDDIEVSTSKTLHADILFIRKENDQAPQITLTGDGQIKSVESVFFALELTRGDANANRHEEQYMFTLPFDCVVGSISGVPGYMEIWGIQRYRGDLRAQKGWYAETATFWEWMSLTDTLKAGEGYLLAFDKKNAHWEEFLEEDLVTKTSLLRLYFPSVQKGFDLKQKSGQQLTVTYPNHPCTLKLHNRYLQDSNWKMIGTTSYNNATVSGYAKDNEEYTELNKAPSFRYRYSYTFDNNNNRTSYNYEPENGKTATYQSFYGYMVQFAGTITWNPINETVPEPLAAPRRAQAERSSVTMRLELANTEGEKQDQTFVALDEDGTTTFDQNKDLNKVFNSGKPNIYTLSEGIPFAGNTLPMEEVIVPVGVKIDAEGEYTFRMPDGTEGMVVELIDYERDITTNLLLFDYTVTLPAGSNESRFALHIQPNKSGVTTGVENVGENGNVKTENGKPSKYLIDGKLIIRTAEGVFDAQGKRL